jgi:hypothetical protein
MGAGVGHHVFSYMVMNVSGENSGLASQAVVRWRHYVLTETCVPTRNSTHSPITWKTSMLVLSASSMQCVAITKDLNTCVRQYTLLFYIIF